MYRVLCDGQPLYDERDETLTLIEPKLELEVNQAGSFTFKLPPEHPFYLLPKKMTSCIQVFFDGVEIFNGRPIEEKVDYYNRKYIVCEGQLAFLNDSIQRPNEYHDMTVRGYLEVLVKSHNSQVEEKKQFEVGIVTVKDNNDSLYRYTNYNSTMKEIKEDLIDDLGGYIRVRNENGHRYLDYIEAYENRNTQVIEFSENLLDLSRNIDLTEIATAVIPLGERLEESPIEALEQRLTIESVNDGVDYLFNQEAVERYGWIVKTVIWDGVTTPEMLLHKGKRWLTDNQFEEMTIEAKAVDLHYTSKDIEQFKLGDSIRVRSLPHGIDRDFPLSKMTIYLTDPASNTITLGKVEKISLTANTNANQTSLEKVIERTPIPSSIVKQAVDQATALITAATHGYVVTTGTEQLIMDTDNIETASKVWRWNLNGLGYSGNGYKGPYSTAITMDGQIVGDRLVGGSVSAEKLDVSYKTEVRQEIADMGIIASQETDEKLKDYYTSTEVDTAIEEDTTAKLRNYYTITQVESAIRNSADAVTLSVTQSAQQYVNGQLNNYATISALQVATDSITSSVTQSAQQYVNGQLTN